mmetsp:Transcript_80/g.208  ORF Transcript_80/g.208 Transcript_80/m.208 type:complete len:423 (-) Transcript_80:169-1437(-)
MKVSTAISLISSVLLPTASCFTVPHSGTPFAVTKSRRISTRTTKLYSTDDYLFHSPHFFNDPNENNNENNNKKEEDNQNKNINEMLHREEHFKQSKQAPQSEPFAADMYKHLEEVPLSDETTNLQGIISERKVKRQPGMSKARLSRLQKEEETASRFLYNESLIELRVQREELRGALDKAVKSRDLETAEAVNEKIRALSLQDAEFVFGETLELLEKAKLEGRMDDVEMYEKEVTEVKKCLPHFTMEGLWVGKYGDHGYELINVTYTGNTLIAYKVTGDRNVPKGEISFTADLSPIFHSGSSNVLKPISLTDASSEHWGTSQLSRFPGRGQVASEGFIDQDWMDGQFVMVGQEYFSFAWLPIDYQIFFGRPSPALTFKLMRESEEERVVTVNDHVYQMRAYAKKCLDLPAVEEDEDNENHFQ